MSKRRVCLKHLYEELLSCLLNYLFLIINVYIFKECQVMLTLIFCLNTYKLMKSNINRSTWDLLEIRNE